MSARLDNSVRIRLVESRAIAGPSNNHRLRAFQGLYIGAGMPLCAGNVAARPISTEPSSCRTGLSPLRRVRWERLVSLYLALHQRARAQIAMAATTARYEEDLGLSGQFH